MWYGIIAVIALIIIWAVSTYNSLVRKKVYVKEAWSGIDVQLKRKGNVLPNLVDTLRMQTNYEGELLTKLTAARTGLTTGSNTERMHASDEMTKLLPSLYAVAEAYPQLGANESFRKLMDEVRDCEDKITYARNRYNISVTSFNTAIRVFPSSVIAGMLHYTDEVFYEIPAEVRADVDNMRIKDIK